MRPYSRCGHDAILRLSLEDVRRNGYMPHVAAGYVNWCGHAQEFVPIPQEDGTCEFVPIIGEAT